ILGNANGAYASSNNQIYLSANFLATSTAEAISAVLLEEIGHFIDAHINLSDSAGDEGAIFAALVQGNSLDTTTLQALKAEDDSGIINLEGEAITVEQNGLIDPSNFTLNNSAQFSTGAGGVSSVIEIYSNNFETSAGSEWSNTTRSTTPSGGRNFLGQFANDTVSLTLNDQRLANTNITLEFDLFIMDSWDGNNIPHGPDQFNLSIAGGNTLLNTTFSNIETDDFPQAYPGSTGEGDYPAGTGAIEIDTLGYTFFGDSVYHLSYTFPNVSNSIILNFSGIGLQGIGDESWGLDNISVSVLETPTPHITLAVSPTSVSEDGTTNLIYTFTRTGATTSALTVNYGITGTANSTDYTGATPGTGKTITFAAGSSTATLTIDPTADTIVESNETVALTLATGTGYNIGTTTAVTGTITNDDLLPKIILSSNQSIFEGNTYPLNVNYNVTLSYTSTQTISVQYATANGTAIAGSDYTSTSGTLTFDPGVTSQVINIPILNDSLNEANETFTLNLTTATNATPGAARTATTTITDTLSASVTTTLPSGVENLTLTGTAAINGTGNANNNVFQGNSANNTLTGLNGNDTYRFLANTALGTDTITETTTGGIDNLDFTGTTAAVNVNLGVATSQRVNSNLKLILSANHVIENATGGTGNDRLTGNALNNTLNGRSGNDQLQGLGGDDTLWGRAGNDILNGGTGNDSLWGGLGHDILMGGVGNDQYLFQSNG
ncbi:MAG: Calx-beta domain-containing protein, partial [Dolichospermum sp.]